MTHHGKPHHKPVVPLTDALNDLDRFIAEAGDRPVPLRAIDETMRDRGIGIIMPVLSIPFIIPVAIPLLSTVCGVPMIVLGALGLSLPIPVPFANMIPALALLHFAAGLLQRDGLAICVGHALTIGSFIYLYLIWDVAVAALTAIFS